MATALTFRRIFGWLMGFVAMTWVWAVALMMVGGMFLRSLRQ